MKINLGPIAHDKGKSLDVNFTTDGESFEVGGERVEFVSPVTVDARVTNTGKCFVVEGHVGAQVALTCHRCLERFHLQLDSPFEVEFFRRGADHVVDELSSRQQRELKSPQPVDDEEAFLGENGVLFTGDEIDLDDTVREEITLALPMKWLCREDCAGICPVCGSNRNVKECSCTVDTTDPRFDALKKLLEDEH
jgi:uncharacterized protein